MSLSINEAKEYIASIDFSKLLDKLINYGGWRLEDALETCKQYRNFLFLIKKYREQHPNLPPSEDIDEFWHNHILDTEAYFKDCQMIFGEYKHHYPYFGIDEKSDMTVLNNAFETTKDLYYKEFGEHITATKSSYPKPIYSLLKKLDNLKKNAPNQKEDFLDVAP